MGKKILLALVIAIPAAVIISFAAPSEAGRGSRLPVQQSNTQTAKTAQTSERTELKQVRKNSPNILLVITDDQPYGTMSAMPKTQSIFASGTTYLSAYASTSLCCPARASIMTGQYVHNHKITSNSYKITKHFPYQHSLQWNLQQAGYQTAAFGKFLNGWSDHKSAPGWDEYISNKGSRIEEDYYTTARAKRFIGKEKNKPWFMLLGYHSPHGPWEAKKTQSTKPVPKHYQEKDLSDKPPYVRATIKNKKENKSFDRYAREGQLEELGTLDSYIEELFKKLKKYKEDRNTLAFFISDQGYMWGQHGGLTGKYLPYQEVLHVPFYMRWPAKIKQSTNKHLVSGVDIAPSIYDATNIKPHYTLDGRSLFSDYKRKWLYAEAGGTIYNDPWRARITADNVFIKTTGKPSWREFYDLRKDPWQLESNPRKITGKMEKQLLQASRCAGKSCP